MHSFSTNPARWRQLGRRDAARILLVTVLITRPDFDAEQVGLDERAEWSHGDLLKDDECFGRDWADGCFTEWNDDDGENGLWLKLARAAWMVMQGRVAAVGSALQKPQVLGVTPAEDDPNREAEADRDSGMQLKSTDDSARWLKPSEAMGMLHIGDKTDRKRRHIFDRLRKTMADEAKRLVGRVQQVEIGAWCAIRKALQSRSSMTDDWSEGVDDVVEIETRKTAERQKKERH